MLVSRCTSPSSGPHLYLQNGTALCLVSLHCRAMFLDSLRIIGLTFPYGNFPHVWHGQWMVCVVYKTNGHEGSVYFLHFGALYCAHLLQFIRGVTQNAYRSVADSSLEKRGSKVTRLIGKSHMRSANRSFFIITILILQCKVHYPQFLLQSSWVNRKLHVWSSLTGPLEVYLWRFLTKIQLMQYN